MNRWRLGRKGCSSPRRFKPEVRDFPAAANNSELRDELLDGELFYTLQEAQILIGGLATALQRPAAAQLTGATPAGARDDHLAGLLTGGLRPPSLTPKVTLALT
jgi:hypothetical protein